MNSIANSHHLQGLETFRFTDRPSHDVLSVPGGLTLRDFGGQDWTHFSPLQSLAIGSRYQLYLDLRQDLPILSANLAELDLQLRVNEDYPDTWQYTMTVNDVQCIVQKCPGLESLGLTITLWPENSVMVGLQCSRHAVRD